MKKHKNAFTLVELIVVITILAILGTIAFISLQGYSKSSRDSVRISDVSSVKTALELFHLDAGKYPLPDNNEQITYGTDILRYQGTAGETVVSQLSRNLNKIPTDPLTDKEYIFSVTGNKNEYEILNLLEGDLALNSVPLTNAAEPTRIPRVDGQYNGLFVKTANYIFPTPTIITSEPITLGEGLILDSTNIKSQVITGGKNIPAIGSVIPKTGELNIILSVYSGTINKESTDAQKINAMKAIQGAYSGTELAGIDTYKVILDKTTDEELISIAETVILKKISSTAQVNTACGETASGETKDFWDISGVDAGQSCDTHKKTFTCENTVWKDGGNIADTTTYSNESCSVAADTSAPTGGNFTIDEGTTTSTLSINLTINCGTDVSNPIEMYISGTGLASGGNVWEICTNSKNITLTTGDGSKTITMKWRDSLGNETTSVISKNIELLPPRGEQLYTTPGTYTWTVPAGVTSVSVVCVGGGGGGSRLGSGGGGELRFNNNISVIPNNTYVLFIGKGGVGEGINDSSLPTSGENSYFSSIGVCNANGGLNGRNWGGAGGSGGTGDGGGNGGAGVSNKSAGGGGAGGYSGNGGNGGSIWTNGSSGNGGGGGGGAGGSSNNEAPGGAGGGGVGLFGEGVNGEGGLNGYINNIPTAGGGGSNGLNGIGPSNPIYSGGDGGNYGGGGAGSNNDGTYPYNSGDGGDGACRIIWPGNTRQFPSTDVGPSN